MKNLKISKSITNRDNSINIYFKDVSKIPRITEEEEIELANRIKKGDKKAEDKLITSNLRFVISVAKQYQHNGIELVDLIQEGSLGLIIAAKKYDPSKGFKFISYAVWWVKQAIVKAISDQCRVVRIPINQVISNNRISKVIKEFEQKHNRMPSSEEISNLSNLSISKVDLSLSTFNKSVSLEHPINEEDSACLIDIIPNDTSATDEEACKDDTSYILNKILDELPYRDKDIMRMYFGIKITQLPIIEIANKFGISGERVRQIIQENLKYIKHNYKRALKELK